MKGMLLGALGCHTATFSIEETADIFEVSVEQVWIWIRSGVLPARKILGMTRVDHEVVCKAAQAQVVVGLFDYEATNEELLDAGDRYF